MTRYSRSVIPGRQGDTTSLAAEMDNLAFGRKNAANDEDDAFESVSDDEAIDFVERAASDRRASPKERRKGGRRRVSDFTPLPGEAAARRDASGGSTRGMVLLGGALVVVAVFGVVVWNAYREGVRPEDGAAAPVIEESGAFKSKPAASAKADAKEEATVFDQVESRPNVAPAPEERAVTPPPAKADAQPVAPKVETKAVEAKPVETKPVLAPVQPASVAPTQGKSSGTFGTTKPADLPVVGGTSKPKVAEAKAAPAKPAPAKPEATVTAVPAEVPPLAGGAQTSSAQTGSAKSAFTPAFSSGGKYAVQIAAPGTEDGAISEWKRAAKRAPNLFAKAEQIVQQAEVNGRTVFRVRAGDFGTPADAEAFCDAFKAAGGQCFRVTK
jgi:hypothetical protein